MANDIPANELPADLASNVNNGAHRADITEEEMYKFYSDWARKGSYNLHLGPDNYRGPSIGAMAVARHCEDKNAEIIDVAAGTGLLGQELKKVGFQVIDALEPAEGMLETAISSKIYRKHLCVPFDDNVSSVANDSYDVLAIAGGMGEGHIKCSALPEMARIVKPGGLVVIIMREAYLKQVEDYIDRLEPAMADLVKSGVWTCVERTVVPRYSFENNGVVFVYKIC